MKNAIEDMCFSHPIQKEYKERLNSIVIEIFTKWHYVNE